jgi:hypothetical protein
MPTSRARARQSKKARDPAEFRDRFREGVTAALSDSAGEIRRRRRRHADDEDDGQNVLARALAAVDPVLAPLGTTVAGAVLSPYYLAPGREETATGRETTAEKSKVEAAQGLAEGAGPAVGVAAGGREQWEGVVVVVCGSVFLMDEALQVVLRGWSSSAAASSSGEQ